MNKKIKVISILSTNWYDKFNWYHTIKLNLSYPKEVKQYLINDKLYMGYSDSSIEQTVQEYLTKNNLIKNPDNLILWQFCKQNNIIKTSHIITVKNKKDMI